MTAILIALSADATDAQIEASAWQAFAQAHPHEAYGTWPERFWQFFSEQAPGVSREQMEAWLRESEEEHG